MQQITLTLDLTPENLQLLAGLIATPTVEPEKEAKPQAKAKPKQTPDTPQPGSETAPQDEEATADEPKHAGPPESEQAEPPAADEPTVSEIVSKTDVRALALKLSKAGKQDALKAIFAKFNAEKLSEVKEADYPELMKELVKANG